MGPMNDAPASVLVVTGPSGAGKTTVARLVAAAFDSSVHIQADDFTSFVVNGWIEPWLRESVHQNHVLGGAVAAAVAFAEGGYTVVLVPGGAGRADAIERAPRRFIAPSCGPISLRARPRVGQRRPGDPDDLESSYRVSCVTAAADTVDEVIVARSAG
jgi:predicted kinase